MSQTTLSQWKGHFSSAGFQGTRAGRGLQQNPWHSMKPHQYKWMDSTELYLQKELAQTRVSQSETLGFRRLYHQTVSSPGGSKQPDVVQDSSMCPDVLIVLQN